MFSGKYGIEEIDLATGKTLRTLLEPTFNMIVDNGYRMLQTYNPVAAVFRLGDGKTAPTMSDTTLESEIAATTSPILSEDLDLVTTGVGDNTIYTGGVRLTVTYMVPEDMVVYEIGIGPEKTNEIFSRVLVDSGVQVHANSALRLTYTFTTKVRKSRTGQVTLNIDGEEIIFGRRITFLTAARAAVLPRQMLLAGYYNITNAVTAPSIDCTRVSNGKAFLSQMTPFEVSAGGYENSTLVYDIKMRLDKISTLPSNDLVKCDVIYPFRTYPDISFTPLGGQEALFNTSVEYPLKLKIPFK